MTVLHWAGQYHGIKQSGPDGRKSKNGGYLFSSLASKAMITLGALAILAPLNSVVDECRRRCGNRQ